jgi:hypothetical protein
LDADGVDVRPVATWTEDGAMAIAEVRLGRGRVIFLGSIFFTRMRDESGVWVNAADRGKLLDEFLTALGVERDSWGNGVWAEIWRSKNGVYDLYPVARVTRKGEETISVAPRIRRGDNITEVVEVSALGHPKVKVDWRDGAISLPAEQWEKMQARVYIAPRAEIARAGLDWFKAQSKIWRELPILPDTARPKPIPVPDDVIPCVEGWQMSLVQNDETWIKPVTKTDGWKPVKLGSFAAMGVPEKAKARFRKTITIPAPWQGRRINLCFRSRWSYGVIPQGRLWINGQLAKVRQPLRPGGHASFTLDIADQAKSGAITLALEVDGTTPRLDKEGRRGRPSGVTGLFFLEAVPATVATTPLDGPWFAARDVGVLTPVKKGEEATYTYLETKFSLPRDWPGKRLFIECPDQVIQHIVLNDQAITVPMNTIDISGLVDRDGENILRWVPGHYRVPEITREQTMVIPELNLVWTE